MTKIYYNKSFTKYEKYNVHACNAQLKKKVTTSSSLKKKTKVYKLYFNVG